MYNNVYNNASGDQPSLQLLMEGHHVTEVNNHESDAPDGQKGTNQSIVKTLTPTSHVEQADMRRMLQARQHKPCDICAWHVCFGHSAPATIPKQRNQHA